MATSGDIRDIMNLGSAPRQPAPKKKRHVETHPRISGVNRELQALMGDSVPPIAIVEHVKYKSKPSISQKLFKPRHWEERSFQHGARGDGLVLRHWKRALPGTGARHPVVASTTTPTDAEMVDASKDSAVVAEVRFEEEFPSEKWNVSIPIPIYSAEQYEASFKSEDWTKEETDYLMDLCRDFDLRWLVIADRYSPQDITTKPQMNGSTDGGDDVASSTYPDRTMEALKSRYYTIAAKILETQTPASNMTQTEFQLWERMKNFDAKTETLRKNMAEKLFERTKDEADEEKLLLEELHRITKNEEDFIKMRRDLYSRLETAPTMRRTGDDQSAATYQTSAGLSMLLQSLLAKEKRFKRPAPPANAEAGPSAASQTDAQKWEKGRHPNQYTRRDTMDTQPEEPGPQKKTSMTQPVVRILTPAEEVKFGVSHPQERLTSGVQFRHEKINRLTMAKSQVQTSKIQAALTELGIPPRLLMPTERVCREFERLVGEINLLLDARKANEKITSEIKILEEARRLRLGLPKEGENSLAVTTDIREAKKLLSSTGPNDGSGADKDAAGEEDQDAEGEVDDSQIEKDEEDETKIDDSATQLEDQDNDEEGEEDDDENQGDTTVATQNNEEEEEEIDESMVDAEEEQDEEDNEEEEEDQDEDDGRPARARRRKVADDDESEGIDGSDDDDDSIANQRYGQDDDDDENEEEGSDADEDAQDEEQVENLDEEDGEDEEQNEGEEDDEAEEENEEDNQDDDDEAAEVDQEESEPSRPPSSHSALQRAHKRSASVISEASRAGSNRSGVGRKRKR